MQNTQGAGNDTRTETETLMKIILSTPFHARVNEDKETKTTEMVSRPMNSTISKKLK